jgi:hypothetical protein
MGISASDRVRYSKLYQEEFYVDGVKLFCRSCNVLINHDRKTTLDSHLESQKHKKAKNLSKGSGIITKQTTLTGTYKQVITENEQINIDLVKIMCEADIPLEKLNKLKPFLLKYCKNGIYHIIYLNIYMYLFIEHLFYS